MAQLRASGSLIAVMALVVSFGCGESSRSAARRRDRASRHRPRQL